MLYCACWGARQSVLSSVSHDGYRTVSFYRQSGLLRFRYGTPADTDCVDWRQCCLAPLIVCAWASKPAAPLLEVVTDRGCNRAVPNGYLGIYSWPLTVTDRQQRH